MNLLENELGELKTELMEMTSMVKDQLEKSIKAFNTFDHQLAQEVIDNEKVVNGCELKIDSKCEHILALFSPVAIDLRFVLASIKMVSDLERIGDNAEGIASYIVRFEKPFDKELVQALRFNEMTEAVLEMLQILVESFEVDNTKLVRTVFAKDDFLDEINISANQVLADYFKTCQDPEKITQAIYLLSMIRKFERTGDYITNIAEEIIFYVKAKVLKHKKNKA
jgi:phosphate transport system protein